MNLFEILAKWPGVVNDAKAMYNDITNNHPTIHTNRFPGWEEMSQADQEDWVRKAAAEKVLQK